MRYNHKTHEAQSLGFGVVMLLAASALFSTHAGAAPASAGEPVAAVGMASAGFADAYQFHTVAQGYVSSVPFLAAQENPEAAPLVAVSTSIQADYTGAPVFSRDEHGKPVELLGVVVNDRGSLLMVPASSFADAAAQQVSMANR